MENLKIFFTRNELMQFLKEAEFDVKVTRNKYIVRDGKIIAALNSVKVPYDLNACALLKDNAKDG